MIKKPFCYDSAETGDLTRAQNFHSSTASAFGRDLAWRDIPEILNTYTKGKTALDFGSGSGLSTNKLNEMGFEIEGVDINPSMVAIAKENYPSIPFSLSSGQSLPIKHNHYDLVFSSFVLFEIPSKEGLLNYLTQSYRALKNEGTFIAITGSEHLYSANWACRLNDYPENKNLISGCRVRCATEDRSIEFIDYYWTEKDYSDAFKQSGLNLIKIHSPLGKKGEGIEWKDERHISPWTIFVASKPKK